MVPTILGTINGRPTRQLLVASLSASVISDRLVCVALFHVARRLSATRQSRDVVQHVAKIEPVRRGRLDACGSATAPHLNQWRYRAART